MKQLKFCSFSTFFIVLIHVLVCLSASLVSTEGFDSLLELPHSGSNGTRSKSKRVIFVGDFGAKGDGFNDDTEAFANAWKKACSFPARTKIVFSAGYTFLIHPIDISGPCKSRLTLEISGTIVAPKDPDVWKGLNRRRWLYFNRVNHLTVQGGGTIDGMGQEWWSRSCKINTTNPCRHAPTAITFHKCKNLKVQNLRVVNSQQMHIAFTNCLRVVISNLEVIAPAESPNTDGIHISASRGVEVKNSIVGTDDCISIVGNSSLIRIRNFACGPGHGISIGSLGKSNSSVRIHDIMVYGALISNTQNGVRIKTWQGGSGSATNIQFLDVLMKNVSNPIIIDQYYCDSPVPCANQTSAVKVENITFIHIKGTSATEEAIKFACSDDSPCEGLFLEDVQLVSHSGGIAKSFCWEAYGSSVGQVEPPPCFACSEGLIEQKAPSNLAFQSF
ncbi:probable polygalacturonase At1g80170 isoform X2 [Citrus clementina]|uniref:probable polygalacturonase At1g80170 isoform X2 n=1 Tax=Citrus clementina TaxID=85681 RepID=UPI000CED4269|nr:probable polygalacturonase At1g80170 isoform X2 [Citrus x clementina]